MSNIDKIYNLKEYKNEITEVKFNKQFDCIPNNLINETLYLNKLFCDKSNYFKYHTKNYAYLVFEEYDIYFTDVREICSSTERIKKIIEIFRIKNTGITTFLNVYFSKVRTRIRTTERFIPFIIFDYCKLFKLLNLTKLQELISISIKKSCIKYNYL